ncbi:MAG TPA: inositol monophosphatase family protein, partial [Beijerinckiaceae bacterium]
MDLAQDAALALMPAVREAAREAGKIACRYFRRGRKTTAEIWSKHGGSPVTEADVAVDSFLKVRLAEALPDAAWLSEETADDPVRLSARRLWIVDPIDGTRAFLSGHPDWAVAIALLVGGEPALGVVHAPAHGDGILYEACRRGGAFRDGARIAVSGVLALRGARVAGPKPLIDRLQRSAGPLNP